MISARGGVENVPFLCVVLVVRSCVWGTEVKEG